MEPTVPASSPPSRLDHRLTRLVAVHLLLWLASVSVFAYASWSHYTREARTLGLRRDKSQPWQTAFPSISDARSTVRMILQFSLVPEKYESDDRVFHLMTAIRLAQLILLAFWAGMGTSRIAIRILGTLVGLVVVASGPLLVQISFPYDCMCVYELKVGNRVVPRTDIPLYLSPIEFVRPIGLLVAFTLLLIGAFFLMRLTSWKLRRLPMPIAPSPPAPFQYSLRHFMVLVVIASAVFGLFRSTLLLATPSQPELGSVPVVALVFLTFAILSVCVLRAALTTGPVRRSIGLVLLLSLVLGLALAMAESESLRRGGEIPWQQVVQTASELVLTTGIVLGSLLVVRRCGYRLVPKASGAAVEGRIA